MKALFTGAYPYAKDKMNLPVASVEAALPFYLEIMGFQLVSRQNDPYPSAVLARDDIQIGLAENGGDPEQEGCFFEVNNAEMAFAELKASGLTKQESWTRRKSPAELEAAGFSVQKHGTTTYRVFFVVAPDGLCYCLGEPQ